MVDLHTINLQITILPAAIFIIGAIVVPFLRGNLRSAFVLLLPVAGFLNLLYLPMGSHLQTVFLGYELVLLKVDKLSLVFGYIFHIAAFLGLLFSIREKSALQSSAALLYAGAAIGVVFGGDLLTLFFFWEAMTFGSLALIWARKTQSAIKAGYRYALVHITGGVVLLFGLIMYIHETGSMQVGQIGLGSLSTYLIFLGLGVNAAWPGIHAWLPDAYPESTPGGTVFLSAFTTKTAVYVLARTFAGAEPLIWIGVAMAVFSLLYAMLENDLRRVLSYSLINQVGFMMVGIGIGTELSLNGTAAHAFVHILYKSLLFMSMGAVLRQTGRTKATDLGGLYRHMPWTAAFGIIGSAAMSAPFFGSFVTKSMIISAASHEGQTLAWLALIFATAGVFAFAGIKVPYFAFFGPDSGIKPKEAPMSMLLAMGLTAALCLLVGLFPAVLYNILPYPVDYVPYTLSHVLSQLQLLAFPGLAFMLLLRYRLYPAHRRAVYLDADWFYRAGAGAFMWVLNNPMARAGEWLARAAFEVVPSYLGRISKNPLAIVRIATGTVLLRFSSPVKKAELEARIKKEKEVYPGDIIHHWPIGTTVIWITLFLLAYLLLYYLQ